VCAAGPLLNILFTFRYALEIVTDSDNFRHAAKKPGQNVLTNGLAENFTVPLLASKREAHSRRATNQSMSV